MKQTADSMGKLLTRHLCSLPLGEYVLQINAIDFYQHHADYIHLHVRPQDSTFYNENEIPYSYDASLQKQINGMVAVLKKHFPEMRVSVLEDQHMDLALEIKPDMDRHEWIRSITSSLHSMTSLINEQSIPAWRR